MVKKAPPVSTLRYRMSPTAARFHEDRNSIVKAMMGPLGAGKTVALVMEMLRIAMEQQPDEHELIFPARMVGGRRMPVRPTRFVVVRRTIPQITKTLLPTFDRWLGPLGERLERPPFTFKAEQPLGDGTFMDMEVWFLGLDGEHAVENLRSMEFTAMAVSEYSDIDHAVVQMGLGRIGRYPSRATREIDGETVEFGTTRRQIIMESNPPPVTSAWYQLFEVDKPAGWRLYKQPPAAIWNPQEEQWEPNPAAENLENLPDGWGYYQRMIDAAMAKGDFDFVSVYIANNYGTTKAGKPVFPAFSITRHVVGGAYSGDEDAVEDFRPSARSPLVIGMDFGLNPAAVITQANPIGGVDVFAESMDGGVTFEEFLENSLLPLLRTKFAGYPVLVVGDPAGTSRSSLSRKTALDMLRERGIAATVAPTNEIEARIDAVNHFLQRNGAFRVSAECRMLIDALAGGYHFAEIRGKMGEHRDVPDKNMYSHIADALQYACLHHKAGFVKASLRRYRRDDAAPPAAFAWA